MHFSVPDPPCDRTLVLVSHVQTMRQHCLEVACACSARRVTSLGLMTKDRRCAGMTLAHVALMLRCEGCMERRAG